MPQRAVVGLLSDALHRACVSNQCVARSPCDPPVIRLALGINFHSRVEEIYRSSVAEQSSSLADAALVTFNRRTDRARIGWSGVVTKAVDDRDAGVVIGPSMLATPDVVAAAASLRVRNPGRV